MLYKKQLEELSALSRKFDAGLLQSQDKDVLHLSFFSSSYDILKQMMALLQSIEESQVDKMREELENHKKAIAEQMLLASQSIHMPESETVSVMEPKIEEEKEVIEEAAVSEELVVEEPVAEDLTIESPNEPARLVWKIAINDRFLFLRELFANDQRTMNDVLSDLESAGSLSEALSYLDRRFQWNWEEEAPAVFRLLLEKTYA